MMNQEFTNYIRSRLASGVSKDQIAKDLLGAGWKEREIIDGFKSVGKIVPAALASDSVRQSKQRIPSKTGKKIAVSFGLIFISAMYALFQNALTDSSNVSNPTSSLLVDSLSSSVPSQTQSSFPAKQISSTVQNSASSKVVSNPSTQTSVPAKTPVKAVTQPAVAPKPTGQYKDGVYTGSQVDAYYGIIQVQATVQNGALADVQFLQHPSDRSTSVRINNHAMPILRQEAIQAQSANVDIVSGATDSSQAFQQSLGTALAMAKN